MMCEKTNEILYELIKVIKQYLAGRHTDCGGELDIEECKSCTSYYDCKRDYEFTEKLEELEKEI